MVATGSSARSATRGATSTARSTGRERLDPRVAAAMGRVPRHRFVPAEYSERAYENRPLPIGHEQTISQPFIVALMTELVDPKPTDRVLEIGTGSGYQAAVLAELVARVYTIEIVRPLGERAAEVIGLRAAGGVLGGEPSDDRLHLVGAQTRRVQAEDGHALIRARALVRRGVEVGHRGPFGV